MFILCYYLCRLFPFDNAKLRRFSSDSKKNLGFFSNLYGQERDIWTNRGNRPQNCPNGVTFNGCGVSFFVFCKFIRKKVVYLQTRNI